MVVCLLGKRDSPTDALEDYCQLLSQALGEQRAASILVRLGWDEGHAWRELWRHIASWKGDWVLAQYTALMWSRRGFPFRFLMVLALLKTRDVHLAVVFHDRAPYTGRRLVDRVRGACQRFVMRSAYRLSDRSILNVPLGDIAWLPRKPVKASFIPIGANVPATSGTGVPPVDDDGRDGHATPGTITVFGVTGGGEVGNEVSDIAFAAKAAAQRLPGVRLVTLGRGSLEAEARLRRALDGSAVDYRPLGVLPADEVSRVLSGSDLSLFVRGPISTQRGSAIASIACGVPVVAYADSILPAPLAEAGVLGVPFSDSRALAEATVRVLTDHQLRDELRERSRRAHHAYFSWEAVATRFLEVLQHG